MAQAQRANPLYPPTSNFETFEPVQARKPGQRIRSVTRSVRRPVARSGANGIVEQASEEELGRRGLGDRTGMFNCPHTGVALAVLLKLLKAGQINKTDRVVVISTAHGLKFVEMKVKYHQRQLEFPCHHANEPVELPARLDAVKEALHKALQTKRQFRR